MVPPAGPTTFFPFSSFKLCSGELAERLEFGRRGFAAEREEHRVANALIHTVGARGDFLREPHGESQSRIFGTVKNISQTFRSRNSQSSYDFRHPLLIRRQ